MDGLQENILTPLKFSSRASKYIMNAFYIDLLCKKGNLKEALLKARMHGMDKFIEEEFVQGNALLPSLTQKEKEETISKVKVGMEDANKKEVEDFLQILFNESLVMACTVFETFLQDSVSVIIDKNPQFLKSLSAEKDITIPQIIDIANYSAIFTTIKNKFLRRFDFKSVEDKINVLIKLGLSKEVIFTLGKKISPKFPNPEKFLTTMFNNRNDVVHKDLLPIKTIDELLEVNEFLSHFFIKLSLDMFRRFGVMTDLHELMNNNKK